jgi:hypothetical protein
MKTLGWKNLKFLVDENEERWRNWEVDEEIGKKNMERVGLEKDVVVCLGKIAT